MTSILITPTTELEAVNNILRSISEAPINTLLGNLPLEATRARAKLNERLRTVLTRGWTFNTDEDVALSSTGGTEVVLSPNVLDVQNMAPRTYTVRGSRVYDPATRSYTLPDAVTGDLVIALPFEELPQPFRTYIYLSAGLEFQNETNGDAIQEKFSMQLVTAAWVSIQNWESRRRKYNLSSNQSVRRAFRRRNA
jgi:hypothetical protein